MRYRQLGRSGLRVSELTLGTMGFGGSGRFADVGSLGVAEAGRQLDRAIEAGVNLVDTANAYSGGGSEEVLGEALRGRRDRLLVATKVRFPTGPGRNDEGLSRHHLIAACEASLRRLQVDHIDLLQVHEWDGATPLEETVEALDSLVAAGKVRYLGCSNFSGWHLAKSLGVAERLNRQPYVSSQIYYSLECRDAEYELLPAAVDGGLGVLVWSPLAAGRLTGKYRRGQPAPTGVRTESKTADQLPIRDEERLYDVVDALVEVAQAHATSPAQVALAWLLTRPGVTSLIIGARNDDQLADNLAAAALELAPEEVEQLERLSRPPLLYPYWHQAASIANRLSPADRVLLDNYREPAGTSASPPTSA
ncbi:MAG: aldo/keto reductase [Actinobacteria bacterium]|nr:aldo/keto reductase [Actinomycetota bacterium]